MILYHQGIGRERTFYGVFKQVINKILIKFYWEVDMKGREWPKDQPARFLIGRVEDTVGTVFRCVSIAALFAMEVRDLRLLL